MFWPMMAEKEEEDVEGRRLKIPTTCPKYLIDIYVYIYIYIYAKRRVNRYDINGEITVCLITLLV